MYASVCWYLTNINIIPSYIKKTAYDIKKDASYLV